MEQEKIRYNSDGEKLYHVGNGLWVPDGYELANGAVSKNEVIRPEIPVVGTMLSILIPVVTNLLLALILEECLIDFSVITLFIILMLVCIFLNSRQIVIFAIVVYQRFAPVEIRSKCLYIPSCSNYTILVLKKYGLIIGTVKAIDRFRRCRYPNGGEDYP